MSWLIIWAYIIGSLVYHGQLSNVIWMALMTFDAAGIIRLTHEDGRAVPLLERLITLREVLMSWTIYVTLKYTTIIPDVIFGWLPLYSAVRWTFFSLFITTRTTSARPIFITFIKPLFSKYETQVDLLLELISATTALITYYTHYYPLDAWGNWCLSIQTTLRQLREEEKPSMYIFVLPFVRWITRRRTARQLAARARVLAAARAATTLACSRIIDAQKQAFEAHRIAKRRERVPRSLDEHIALVKEEYDNLVDGPIVGPHPVDVFRRFDLSKTPLEEAIGYVELVKTLPVPPKLRFDSAPIPSFVGPVNADLSRLPQSPTPYKHTSGLLSPADDLDRGRSPGAPSPERRDTSRFGTFPGAWPQQRNFTDHAHIKNEVGHIVHEEHIGTVEVAGPPRTTRGTKRSAKDTPEGHQEKYARTHEYCPGAPRKHATTLRQWSSDSALVAPESLFAGRSGLCRSDEELGEEEVFGPRERHGGERPQAKRARVARRRDDSTRPSDADDAKRTKRSAASDAHKQLALAGTRHTEGPLARGRPVTTISRRVAAKIDEHPRPARAPTETTTNEFRQTDRSTHRSIARSATTVDATSPRKPASFSFNTASYGLKKSSVAGTARPVIPAGGTRYSTRTLPTKAASSEIKLIPVRRAPVPYDVNARPTRLAGLKDKDLGVKYASEDKRKRVPLEPKVGVVPGRLDRTAGGGANGSAEEQSGRQPGTATISTRTRVYAGM